MRNCGNSFLKEAKKMFQKINENAYFLIDTNSFLTQINTYDPLVANQSICYPDIMDEPVPTEFENEDSE